MPEWRGERGREMSKKSQQTKTKIHYTNVLCPPNGAWRSLSISGLILRIVSRPCGVRHLPPYHPRSISLWLEDLTAGSDHCDARLCCVRYDDLEFAVAIEVKDRQSARFSCRNSHRKIALGRETCCCIIVVNENALVRRGDDLDFAVKVEVRNHTLWVNTGSKRLNMTTN